MSDRTGTVRPATTSFGNTQGHNVYTCDAHATAQQAKKVGGPYRTWETGALFTSGRRRKWCEVCTWGRIQCRHVTTIFGESYVCVEPAGHSGPHTALAVAEGMT